ncbi:MAG: AAA family ATPase [Pseudomonadota bacterium]|nr:AAA family ATPase [Pseudomonadota bacterium]
MQIRKAQRQKAKLRLGISAPSGAGKSYSSLLLAFGLGGKVGVIDTENGSADLYAHLGDYDIIGLQSPYTISKYLAAIKEFEKEGYTTIIIDSLTHAWSGEGGLLDKQGKIADSGKGNSYTAWRSITPEHNSLVEAMLQSPCHIIATMRAKTEYVLETGSNGKQTPKKVGLAPIQRDGMEFEFTIFMDIDSMHIATATKDRTSILDGTYFKITEQTGKDLLVWLEQGADAPPQLTIDDYRKIMNEAKSKEDKASAWATVPEHIKIIFAQEKADKKAAIEAKKQGAAA